MSNEVKTLGIVGTARIARSQISNDDVGDGLWSQIKQSNIMPFDPANGSDPIIEKVSLLDDAYELLQYSTELFLADVISKGVFIKVKYLIDTMDAENHEMARQILHAKAEK